MFFLSCWPMPRTVRTLKLDIISTSLSSYLEVTSTSSAEVGFYALFALFFGLRPPGR